MIIITKWKCTVKCQFTVSIFLYDHSSRLWLYVVPAHTCKPSMLWYLSPVKPKWVSQNRQKQRLPFLNTISVPQCASLHLWMMVQYTILQENTGFSWWSATNNAPQCDQLLGQDSNSQMYIFVLQVKFVRLVRLIKNWPSGLVDGPAYQSSASIFDFKIFVSTLSSQ